MPSLVASLLKNIPTGQVWKSVMETGQIFMILIYIEY